MELKIYDYLPAESMEIRTTVFVKEQGFVDLPDETDSVALHFVLYDCGRPIATCRAFADGEGGYVLGRFAVIRERRGKGIGSDLIEKIAEELKKRGIPYLKLHSQYTAKDFYAKNGFIECQEPEYEQNALHVWMIRDLSANK